MSAAQEHGRTTHARVSVDGGLALGNGRSRRTRGEPDDPNDRHGRPNACPWRWLSPAVAVHAELGEQIAIRTEVSHNIIDGYVVTLTGQGEPRTLRVELRPGWTLADVTVIALTWAGWEAP